MAIDAIRFRLLVLLICHTLVSMADGVEMRNEPRLVVRSYTHGGIGEGVKTATSF